jgi:hypothetical protein
MRLLLILLVSLLIYPAFARDYGQWELTDPIVKWYKSLHQPESVASCCGEADAYWADLFEATPDGQYVAIITDDRDNEQFGRTPVLPGTRIIVPKDKIVFDQGNPTGHGVIFLSSGGFVYCYVTPTGG